MSEPIQVQRPSSHDPNTQLILSELGHIRAKQDELCERTEKIEKEIVGEPGDGDKPTLRNRQAKTEERLTALEKQLADRKKMEIAVAGAAGTSLLGMLGFFLQKHWPF